MAGRIDIGQLMIEIGLKDSFSKELSKINKDIKALEKGLKNLDKNFGDVSKSVTGLTEKQKLLNDVITKSQQKTTKLTAERDKIIAKYQKEAEELERIKNVYGENSTEYKKQAQVMLDSANQLNRVNDQLDTSTRITQKYITQLDEVTEQYNRLTSGVETYDERLQSIKQSTGAVVDELEIEQKVLQSQNKVWQEYDNVIQQTSVKLESSISTYKAHREEMTRLSQEESKYTKLKAENLTTLEQERSTLEQTKKTYGEISVEYQNQARYVEELTKQQIQYETTLSSITTQQEEVAQSMRQSKKEIVDNVTTMKEMGSTKLTQNLNKSAEVLTRTGEALQGASIVGATIVGGTSAIFMEYETGLAKVGTLVDGEVVNLQKVGKDIVKISNDTGKAVGDVMEAGYSALSSGVEIGNLNEFLATSSKMAVAGFTSTDSAVRLLTQTMNTYGESAGSVSQIADMYAKIQDVGVITIDEMTNVMSESLALGSAYGVQLEDIGASFVKMTLQGTNASESGTQVARMLEELGDSGSKVSGILQDKTGKSFRELMQEGYHLDDVLGIINDHAQETGVEMTSLWGSSNAGIGALQILSKQGGTFKDVLAELGNSSGLLDTNFNKLSQTSQFKLSSAINQLKNSLIDIGGAFAPVINGVSNVITGFAKGLDLLPNSLKNIIGYITGFTAVLSPLMLALGKFNSGLGKVIEEIGGKNLLEGLFDKTKIDKSISDVKDIPRKIKDTLKDDIEVPIDFDVDEGKANKKVGDVIDTAKDISKNNPIDLEIETDDVLEGAKEVSNAIEKVGTSASGSTGILSKLGGVMKAHPLLTAGAVIGATSLAIYGVTKAIETYNKKMHEGRDAVNNYNKSIQEHKTAMQGIATQKDNLTGLVDRYEELSKKTNKTAQETEEYKNILQQVAEIDPNLVEYDVNGDPIGLKIGLVEDLIAKLELAYQKEEQLLNNDIRDKAKTSKKAYDEKSSELSDRKTQLELDREENNKTVVNPTTGASVNKWMKQESETYDEYFTRMKDVIAESRRINAELQAIRDEDVANRQEVSNARRDYYQNMLDNSKKLANLTAEEKSIAQNMLNTFDFSEFSDAEVEGLWKKIENGYSKLDEASRKSIDSICNKQQELNSAYSNGSISAEEYTSATNRSAVALSNLLGISLDEAKKILLGIEFDSDQANKSIADLEETKANLLEATQGWEDLTVEQRVDYALDIALDESTPDHIRSAIWDMLEDGQITDEEYKTLIDLIAEMNEDDFKADFYNKFEDMKSKLEATDDTKVQKEIIMEYSTKVEGKEDLLNFLDEVVGRTETIKINTLIEDGNIGGLVEYINSLPAEKQVAVATAIMSSGELKPTELLEFVNSLPAEVRSQAITEIVTSGDMSPSELADFVTQLPTEIRTNAIIQAIQEGDMSPSEIEEFISSLPAEVQTMIRANSNFQSVMQEKEGLKQDTSSNHKINSDNTQVVNDKNSNKQNTSSTHKQNSDNSAVNRDKNTNKQNTSSTHKQNSDNSAVNRDKNSNKQPTSSKHSIGCNNSAVTSAKSSNAKNTSSTHTINVVQKVTKFVTSTIGKLFKSASEPRVVEDIGITVQSRLKPRIADDMTNMVSDLSLANNQLSNTGSSISANMDNVVSALATSVDTYADTGYTIRALESDVNLLENLEAVIDKVTASLNRLEKQQDRTWGSSKAKLLQQEISLLQEQQRLTKATENNMKQMANALKGSLKNKGFTFNDDGSIDNYNTKLISMTENVEKLKKKMDDYTGDSESYKKQLSDAYNKANDELSKTKEQLDEYLNLTFNEMPNASAEWEDLANQIADAKAEIIEATHEARVFTDVISSELREAILEKFDTQIDILDIKMDLSGFDDQIVYITEQIDLMNQAMEKTNGLIGSMTNQRNWAKDTLLNQGFEFDHDGNIKNAEARLKKLRDSLSTAEYEALKEIYDEYVEIHYSTLPSLEEQWWDYKASIEEAKKEIEEIEKQVEEFKSNAKLDTLEQSFEHLNEELSILEARFDNAISTKDKSKLLMEQLRLIQRIKSEQQVLTEEYLAQANILKNDLAKYGVKFDYDDSIKNLEQAMSNLTDIEEMEELQDLADAYNDMLSSFNDGTAEIEALENQMSELRDEVLELQKEFENFKIDTWTQKLENGLKILENDLEKLQNSADLTNTNMIKNWNQQINKIHELENKTAEMISFYKQRKNQLQKDLVDFGFRFSDDGSIDNYYEQLTLLKEAMSETSFEILNESLEEYFEINLDTIPQLENQLIDFQKQLEDIANEKLEVTKKIEDKITEVYKKQIEERIKIIEEERDTRIEALEKARKEYEKFRDEAQYKDDYNEQLKEVQELQSKVEIAKRDTSLSGQKRLQELMEQLEEEQKNLQDLVRDKVDQDINDMFDNEMDRLETNAEDEIKQLEELWSASKVAEAVQQALATGIFKDIDGNIKELDNALLDFANSSEEYFGIMGDTLKAELVNNLQTALEVMKELDKTMSNIDYDSVKFGGVGYNAQAMTTNNNTTNNTNNNVTVELNPIYNVTANNNTLDEQAIMSVLEQSKDDMINEIENSILKYMK